MSSLSGIITKIYDVFHLDNLIVPFETNTANLLVPFLCFTKNFFILVCIKVTAKRYLCSRKTKISGSEKDFSRAHSFL